MAGNPAASLIVSTYEMPRHLALVCAALRRQSFADYEVLICDDGSGAETSMVLRDFERVATVPVFHLWQENRGFRKCRILNEALRRARGSTMIFLDGDCVPHRHFVRDHVEQQEPGYYLAGRRVELGPWISATLEPEEVERGFFDRPQRRLVESVLRGDSEHLQRAIRVPFRPLRRLLKMERVDDLKGCNWSVARADLEAINGFDEDYEGYGREDTDAELRLRNRGLRIKSMKGLALQFHVWHPRREFTPANDDRLAEVQRTGRTWCERGMRRGTA
jgi:glycosyltransferase involved in cell wall biosynthesis